MTTTIEGKKIKEKDKKDNLEINPEEMLKMGLHFGHRLSQIHPKMKDYVSGIKNGVYVIDLEKTAEKLKNAIEFIKKVVSEGKTLLLVGTKVQTKDITKKIAKECGFPYITERWLGGTLTNFKTIKKRIDYFKDLEGRKNKGELEKYTKKEKIKIEKELKDLEKKFEGIKDMSQIPDAIFVLDVKKDNLAVKEAKRKGIKIIAITDTNNDPSLIDYPIPANDDAVSSVTYILEKVKEAIIKEKSN